MLRHGAFRLLNSAHSLHAGNKTSQALYEALPILEATSSRLSQSSCRGFAAQPEEVEENTTSDRVTKLAEEIMHLNLLEVADLTEILQTKLKIGPSFGNMPMGMMGAPGAPAAAPAAAEEAPKEAEKTEFDVKLEGFDAAAKIKVIKEIRVITELGLKEAKELVEKSPIVIKSGLKKEEAEELKKKIEAVGGKIVLE